MGFVLPDICRVVSPELLRLREQLRKPEKLVERGFRVWNPALRLGQEPSLAIDHLHAETAAVGSLVHKTKALLERVLLHERVWVEQQHIFAGRDTDGLVVGSREADVVLVLN